MACLKLSILDEQYKRTELKVSYFKKELTSNFCAENVRSSSFNAKELDEETGLIYYGARYRKPGEPFISRDKMFESKPFISPYAFCRNNPLRYIDPDGNDEYEFDKQGKLTNVIENKNADILRVIDADGNKTDSREFAAGTIEKHKTQTYSPDGKSTATYDYYRVRGDENGTAMFEFLSQNTDVEWGHAKLGIAGDKGLNYLTTSNKEAGEPGIRHLINGQLKFGYTAREFNHNHPGNTPYPSGSWDDPTRGACGEWGDVGFSRAASGIFGNKVKYNIFTPSDGQYIEFNPRSRYENYVR